MPIARTMMMAWNFLNSSGKIPRMLSFDERSECRYQKIVCECLFYLVSADEPTRSEYTSSRGFRFSSYSIDEFQIQLLNS